MKAFVEITISASVRAGVQSLLTVRVVLVPLRMQHVPHCDHTHSRLTLPPWPLLPLHQTAGLGGMKPNTVIFGMYTPDMPTSTMETLHRKLVKRPKIFECLFRDKLLQKYRYIDDNLPSIRTDVWPHPLAQVAMFSMLSTYPHTHIHLPTHTHTHIHLPTPSPSAPGAVLKCH